MKRNFQSLAGICRTGLLVLLTGLFVGCTDSVPEQDTGAGEVIECSFRLDTGTPVSVETRGIITSPDATINNVWVVQLNASGTAALVPPAYVSSVAEDNVINLLLKKEQSTLYFFVNTGQADFFNTAAELSSFTTNTLETKTLSRSNFNSWNDEDNIPMYGTWVGMPTPPKITDADGNEDKVELTRGLACLSIGVMNKVSSSFKNLQISLHNVPGVLQLAPTATGTYPATGITFYESTPLALTSGRQTFYIPENCRGTGSGRYETEKTASAVTGGDYATYIEIKGTYNGIGATYRFYLGSNNTNDYNVKRNILYTVGITISGKNLLDARLTMDAYPLSVSSSGATWGDGSNESMSGTIQ